MRKYIQTHNRHRLNTMPFRYSHFAIAVPYDLIEKPAKRTAGHQNRNLFGAWLLTAGLFAMLRRCALPVPAELFLDTFGRALSVAVVAVSSHPAAGRRRCAERVLLANLTLFGMLVGSMCAGVFYGRYTETRTMVQRVRTVEEFCASGSELGFAWWVPHEMFEYWRWR